jgi:hypothetical protein
VIILPGPSGSSTTHSVSRLSRAPLQSVQQEEVQVVKEIESPSKRTTDQIRGKKGNTFFSSSFAKVYYKK